MEDFPIQEAQASKQNKPEGSQFRRLAICSFARGREERERERADEVVVQE